VNPRHPSPTFSDAFRRSTHRLRDHHRPGRARFTWNARGAIFQLLTSMAPRSRATILVPGFHCLAVTKPIIAAGFTIDCYRVRPDLTIDIEDLATRLHADVAAVLVIHYFGFPTDLDRVQPLVRAHGALLVEDCSHSFLTQDRGTVLGQRGDYAVFSYYKCVPSLVGGALVANGNAPLPQTRSTVAPWPVRAAVLRRWLQLADARAPKRSLRLVQRVLGSLVYRGRAHRSGPKESNAPDAANALPSPRFLDDPYLFDLSLARAGLPACVRRVIETSRWNEIALIRRRNYATLSRLIPDSEVLHRPLPRLPDGVVPYMFPLTFRDRRRHEEALRDAGVPYLRFGETLDTAIERASGMARKDAEDLSGSLMLLPIHQDFDEERITAYAGALRDCAARSR